MSVKETLNKDYFAWNRQVYQRLKLALSLGLRRQIFFAVCDDVQVRNQVATRLHSNLAYPLGQVLHRSDVGGGMSTPAYPRLVTLRLNLNDPNPIGQINQWLANYPPPMVGVSPDSAGHTLPIPAFQIVGIELLTKQAVAVQRLFLNYLRLSEQYFSHQDSSQFLESSLLFWLPRPWFYAIQQSAPNFWQYRNGIFTFAGEPTPTVEKGDHPEDHSSSYSLNLDEFDQSILDASITPPAPKDQQPQNVNGVRGEDFPVQTRGKVEYQPVRDLSLTHINKELQELVKATVKTNTIEDGDENWQIQQIIWEIEELHEQQASGQHLAAAYQKLGNLYRLQIEEGESNLDNLMAAILAYQEAVSYDDISPQLPDILNDLGTLYWMLHRSSANRSEGQTYIEQGIEFYRLALKLITPETHEETYARVQNNLGTAYGDLARFADPVENWQQAVLAYDEALRYRSAEVDPLKFAACQNNLATAYWHLGQYSQPMEHLTKAIAIYNLALQYYNPGEEPLKYAMIQNNIGTAHWNLAQYENPAENLKLAVKVYREALKYRTPANLPNACAATQNNLATAYWHIAHLPQITKEEKPRFLKLCIISYEEALNLSYSIKDMPLSFDLLTTHNNLGLAHYELVIDLSFKGDKNILSQHLEAALDNHLRALNGLDHQPEVYQTTFNYIIKVIRTFHEELGVQGQNLALSKLPGQLIPEVLPKL